MTDQNKEQSSTTPGRIILSAGMGSAGSGWIFNLTNELLMAAGERDVRQLRDDYGLSDILCTRNCAHDLRKQRDVARLLAVASEGHTFVVKSHKPPSRAFRRLQAGGLARATYIFRDPRDVVVSVFERGEKGRARGRTKAFARFKTMNHTMLWVRYRLLSVYDAWARCPGTHLVRYEDLRADPMNEMQRLVEFLRVDVEHSAMQSIVSSYEGDKAKQKPGSHYREGGARRDALTLKQRARCDRLFGAHLKKMGYEP